MPNKPTTTRKRPLHGALAGIAMLWLTAPTSIVMAQDIDSVRTPETPLVLKKRGSFFVGGTPIEQTFVELGSSRAADRITVGQMYVEFMVPDGVTKSPIVLVHGAGLSGKSYDTTPDGRMGWFEYFVRRAHPTYVVDQIGRARSGFDQAVFNRVGAGEANPGDQPKITRMGDRIAGWINFRFGPTPGDPYPEAKFPVEAAAELSRQAIPDISGGLPTPNPNFKALSTLATKLGGAVLVGHSQAGDYPLETALLTPDAVKAMVLVEPGRCNGDTYSDAQVARLAKTPMLVVFGDNLSAPTGLPGPGWQDRFDECQRLIARVRKAGGQADLLHPPALGIRGNSHLIMQDTNNLAIADLILTWIDKHTDRAAG